MRALFKTLVMLILCSCFSRSAMMTHQSYDDITVGTTVAELKQQVGEPYAIHSKGSGTQEYEYIDRIPMGREVIEENHYFLIISDGKVAGKYHKTESQPAYNLIYQDDPNYFSY